MEDNMHEQHQQLLERLYRLRDGVKAALPVRDIAARIEEVISYTRFHMQAEEAVLREGRYPQLDWHRARHEELLKDALRFKDKLEYLGEEDFLTWFNRWPLNRLHMHIAYADKQAEDYLSQTRDS